MCIFCDIVDRKIPSKKIYEDSSTIIILDISQATKGHTLVIPKKHYDNFLEMPQNEFTELMNLSQNMAKNIKNKIQCDGLNILINTGESAGQTINHMHCHIIPRYKNDDLTIEFKNHDYNLDNILNQIK